MKRDNIFSKERILSFIQDFLEFISSVPNLTEWYFRALKLRSAVVRSSPQIGCEEEKVRLSEAR